MTTSLVIRDTDGVVINIGSWNYIEETLEDGTVIVHNPYPTGATESQEDIIVLTDGGLGAAEETLNG